MALGTNSYFHRRYWPAWVALVLGLAATGWLAHGLFREALVQDQQRFRLEALILSQLLEGTMERYEERLARLADHCAQFDELPAEVWEFRRSAMTDFSYNLPSVMQAAYCPKIVAAEFESHAARGRALKGESYAFDPESVPGRELALPVWHSWSRSGFPPLQAGTDLARPSTWYPPLAAGLARPKGWVSSAPMRVPRADGGFECGFWFVMPLFKADQGPLRIQRRANELPEDFTRRVRELNRSAATGMLAVFVSTDRMVEQAYNQPTAAPRVHVRFYASGEPNPESLFNSGTQAPANPRHREVTVLPWYGKRWALELTSTPVFEADSARDMAYVAGAAGTGMTLLASALVGLALRARHRQEALTEQIREARDALASAQKEREKLSHDLHDNTIQSLYAMQLDLGHTAQKLAEEPQTAGRELAAVRAELDSVIAEVRRFVLAEERPEQPVDLPSVLKAAAERARAGNPTKIELRCEPKASDRLTGVQAVQLANIGREALSNCVRHARARCVDITLRSDSDAVCLEVVDDGIGFDPNSATGHGVGLRSMAIRSRDIGGTLHLDSAPGRGTRVTIRVPAAPLEHNGEPDPADDEPEETET
ncbi:MAG: sensor histidine kinase [Verrucomicrobiae bacterium]|nr:sensor histidine kinase [Verrucomicrobiae bacterium]